MPNGVLCPQPVRSMNLEKLIGEEDNDILTVTGRILLKYAKYREVLMKRRKLYYHSIIMHFIVRASVFIQISFIL